VNGKIRKSPLTPSRAAASAGVKGALREPLLGAIEAGGTKFCCAIARGLDDVLAETRVPTTTPAETLQQVGAFFAASARGLGALDALGIASFGPVDLEPSSPGWGHILATPKPGWSGTDLAGTWRRQLGRPVAIDTDVNAAARAELELGAGRGLRSLVYVTVGTGIGGGAVIEGQTVKGLLHPEMGHIGVRRAAADTAFGGICPFHGDCLEGLASGPAILARWGCALSELAGDHPAWSIIGDYLGQLASTITLVLSPQRIVFGGGVMQDPRLLAKVRLSASKLLNGYLPRERLAPELETYITPPALESRSGIMGALLLARHALRGDDKDSG
jgi:fructokinase